MPAEARDRLGVCLRIWPRSAAVHLAAARAARLTGDVEQAETHLNRCLKLGPATHSVQLEFLLLRVQAGEVDEVAPTLIDSVENDHPETPLILETLSRAYMQVMRYEEAFDPLIFDHRYQRGIGPGFPEHVRTASGRGIG